MKGWYRKQGNRVVRKVMERLELVFFFHPTESSFLFFFFLVSAAHSSLLNHSDALPVIKFHNS